MAAMLQYGYLLYLNCSATSKKVFSKRRESAKRTDSNNSNSSPAANADVKARMREIDRLCFVLFPSFELFLGFLYWTVHLVKYFQPHA